MPSFILGLSALVLGATGQSQYRPGQTNSLEDNEDYLDNRRENLESQAEYRPRGSNGYDYEYEYDDSIAENSLGENQHVDALVHSHKMSSTFGHENADEILIAGSTGNVGAGINGDLNNPFVPSEDEKEDQLGTNLGSDQEPIKNKNSNSRRGEKDASQQRLDGENGAKSGWSLEEAIPGVPGEDYPTLSSIPETSFTCDGRTSGGFYADQEAECQAFHVCADHGLGGLAKYSFLCPNGTIFNQGVLVCDWWFNVDCSEAATLYTINEKNAAERDAFDSNRNEAQNRELSNRLEDENSFGKYPPSKVADEDLGTHTSSNPGEGLSNTSSSTNNLLANEENIQSVRGRQPNVESGVSSIDTNYGAPSGQVLDSYN